MSAFVPFGVVPEVQELPGLSFSEAKAADQEHRRQSQGDSAVPGWPGLRAPLVSISFHYRCG